MTSEVSTDPLLSDANEVVQELKKESPNDTVTEDGKNLCVGDYSHECDVCGKTFTTKGSLKRHSSTHSSIKPHLCNVCGKAFSRKGHLDNHSLIHSGKKNHVCSVCGKAFTLKEILEKHSLSHLGVKPHLCNVCGKSFTLKGHLRQHLLIHNEKSYSCQVCGKTFAHPWALKRHSYIHGGVKPHVCDICNKAFTQKTDLLDHASIHIGIKPHLCEVCGRAFTYKRDLKNHLLIHSGVKSFVCDICGKAFTQRVTWRKHCLIHSRRNETSSKAPSLTSKVADDEPLNLNDLGGFPNHLLSDHLKGHQDMIVSYSTPEQEECHQTAQADQTQRENTTNTHEKCPVSENRDSERCKRMNSLMKEEDEDEDEEDCHPIIIKKEIESEDFDYSYVKDDNNIVIKEENAIFIVTNDND